MHSVGPFNQFGPQLSPHTPPNSTLLNRNGAKWMDSTDEDRVFLSVVALAELRYGVRGHDPENRIRTIPSTQWHPLSAESLQQLSVRRTLSGKAGDG